MTKEKNENFNKIMVPNSFFATFNTDTAYNKALEMKSFKYKDEVIELQRPHEPSNIIWENRDNSDIKKNFRKSIVILIMVVVAILFFGGAVVGIQTQLLYKYLRSPPGVECSEMDKIYGDQLIDMAAYELVQFERLKKQYPMLPRLNEKISRKGSLTCFCLREIE